PRQPVRQLLLRVKAERRDSPRRKAHRYSGINVPRGARKVPSTDRGHRQRPALLCGGAPGAGIEHGRSTSGPTIMRSHLAPHERSLHRDQACLIATFSSTSAASWQLLSAASRESSTACWRRSSLASTRESLKSAAISVRYTTSAHFSSATISSRAGASSS